MPGARMKRYSTDALKKEGEPLASCSNDEEFDPE
jgi:hypothetical protein